MKNPMGTQHPSDPATEADKEMSARHKAHRKEVESLGKTHPLKALLKSVQYHPQHAMEHIEGFEKSSKELAKHLRKGLKKAQNA